MENKTNHYRECLSHHKIVTGGLLSLSILSTLALGIGQPSAYAESGTVDLNVTVPTSCSLSIADGTSDTLTATINPGTTGTIGTSTIKAFCNDPAGLAVYAVGYTNDTYGDNHLTATINGTNVNINSNVTTSGTPAASEWNMTLAPISGDYAPIITNQTTGDNPVGNFTVPHTIPEQYTKVAYRNTHTDVGETATGAQFTARFDAFISSSQSAGTYEGLVKFLLVHPNVLAYDDQTGEPSEEQPMVLAEDPEAPKIMQNVATWGSSVAAGETVEAVDIRDNSTYTVARLADGKLWMTKNLRLNLATANITAENTNLPAASFVTDAADSTKNAANNSTWCGDYTSECYDKISYSTVNLGDATVGSDGHTYD
jgi:hypothetical protein